MKTITLLLLTATLCAAQSAQLEEPRTAQSSLKPFYWSVSVALTGTAIDSVSSYGYGEASPFLRGADGRFGTRALILKTGTTATLLIGEVIAIRLTRHNRFAGRIAAACSAVNFSIGAGWTVVGAHNFAVRHH